MREEFNSRIEDFVYNNPTFDPFLKKFKEHFKINKIEVGFIFFPCIFFLKVMVICKAHLMY